MPAPANTVKIVAAVAAIAAIVIMGTVLVFSGSDEPDTTATTSPTPSVTSTPGLTATLAETATLEAGSLSPREQADAFALDPVSGVLDFFELAAGETVGEDVGVYFMNAETGAIEGWRAAGSDLFPNPIGFSGDNRFAGFLQTVSREPHVLRGYLADRGAGTVYGWQGDAQLVYAEGNLRNIRRGEAGWSEVLATSANRVLFRIEDPDDADWFIVVSMDPEPAVVSKFQIEGGYLALLSADGSLALVFGEGTWLIDVDSGAVRSLDTDIPDSTDLDGAVALRNIPEGDAFLLSISGTRADRDGLWLRYTWQGEPQQGASGAFRVYASANGEFVAMAEPLSGSDESWPVLVSFNAVSTADGAELFRVVGAVESFGYTTGNIWLADGAGIVLTDPSFDMMVALQNGSFRPYVGMPSPTDSSQFAATSPVELGPLGPIRGPTVFDAEGNVIAATTASAQSFRPPWGLIGSEIRFLVPHGGHGGIGFALSLVTARVDQPPYLGPINLSLSTEAVGSELLAEPGDGGVFGMLSTPIVTVLETRSIRLESNAPGYQRHCDLMIALAPGGAQGCNNLALWGQWALVTEQGNLAGQPAWLLIAVRADGE